MPVRYEDVTAARVTGCRGEKLTAVSSLVKPDHHARVPVPPCVHSSTLTSIGASPFLGLQFFCIPTLPVPECSLADARARSSRPRAEAGPQLAERPPSPVACIVLAFSASFAVVGAPPFVDFGVPSSLL